MRGGYISVDIVHLGRKCFMMGLRDCFECRFGAGEEGRLISAVGKL